MAGGEVIGKIFGLFAGNKRVFLVVATLIAAGGFAFKGNETDSKRFDYDTKVSDEPIVTKVEWGAPREEEKPLGLKDLAHRIKNRSWGSAVMELGLSFGIAMILGSLVRAFVRTMITLIVVVGGALWFLQHKGIIEPFWQDYYGVAESTRVWAMAQFESVKTFFKGSLPSAGAAMAGFGFGLKK
ncbi:MAG: hypothetical protein P1U86_03105 [Verrucomicrobiales bacterium]|nr:hypothetical protein [Verrucomicrobiales bacterium]